MANFLDEAGLAELWGMICDKHDGFVNEYVWEKHGTEYTYQTEAIQNVMAAVTYGTIYYGTGFRATVDGFVLENESSLVTTSSNWTTASKYSVLKGMYAVFPTIQSNNGYDVVYVSPDATFSYASSAIYLNDSGGASKGYHTIEANKEIFGYVNSPDPNAYPVDDGFTYTALGQLGNKVRIATGSYGATSVYGQAKANSLTFDFVPKMIFILEERNNGRPLTGIMVASPLTLTTSYQYYGYMILGSSIAGSKLYAKFADNTLYWYADSAANQYNESAYKYHYIAIG